jgi:hypothetical protein
MKMTFSAKVTHIPSLSAMLAPNNSLLKTTSTIGNNNNSYPVLSMQNDMFGRLQNAKPCGSCGGFR